MKKQLVLLVSALVLLTDLVSSDSDSEEEDVCEHALDGNSESLKSGANDVVVVRQDDGHLLSTPFVVMVGKFSNWRTIIRSRQGRQASKRTILYTSSV